ncbi:hypothetical protein BC835DRAFT_1544869 [Cytidiella melzeri]|nr:hypothetical protein BC835DRAFT_1544869 [Cytidiella melzeri]
MVTPPQVVQWVKRTYPKPEVDPEWLDGCYTWIENDLKLNPAKDLDTILYNVEAQLLQSDLTDSMLAGTGLPPNISELNNVTLRGLPILVEIVAITEIGHSAFSLQNVRQARIERADLAGLAEEEENDGDDRPIPNYPRSMLKLVLSDGSTIVNAIEYKRLPEFKLGETPLGFKMLLKDVTIRRGIAFLEPSKVVLKGYQTEGRQTMQDADFIQSLHERLGIDDPPDDNGDPLGGPLAQQPHPAHIPPPPQQLPPERRTPPPPTLAQRQPARSPLQEIDTPSEPGAAGPSHTLHEDDEDLPRRRKVPNRKQTSSPGAAARKAVPSRYFSSDSGKGKGREVELARELRLSPHRHGPVVVPDSDEEEDESCTRKPPTFRGKDAPPLVVHSDSDVVATGSVDPAGRHSPNSSEFDFDFDVTNEEFLSQLDKVEKEAIAASTSTTVAPRESSKSSATLATTSTHSAVAASTTQTRATSRRPEYQPPPRTQPVVNLGTVTIDDDDEESDEKENMPVPTRRVRPRVDPNNVIEISD